MSDRLEDKLKQFVLDHREEFDTEEPDAGIWDKIRDDIDPGKKKPAPVVRMQSRWRKYSVAAAVIILLGGALWYLRSNKNATPGEVANSNQQNTTNPNTTNQQPTDTNTSKDNLARTPAPATVDHQDSAALAAIRPKNNDSKELESSMDEEMYHYARLVELKHKELKTIEKDEPLLYKQFSSDVYKLDSVYHDLRGQLPNNPNREQLLEAMLQNLQLQMELLNHQLEIVRQINHTKKTEYEKAYKTI
jgi:type IV secretory pathway VirB10-like protein